jgi:hypothetical protein
MKAEHIADSSMAPSRAPFSEIRKRDRRLVPFDAEKIPYVAQRRKTRSQASKD